MKTPRTAADMQSRMDALLALLLPYQRAWVQDKSRFLCGVWARQTGKSFATGATIALDLVATPKTTWMIAAPSERQSLESLGKVKDWIRSLRVQFAEETVSLRDVEDKAGAITLGNGSRCIAVPGKPDTVRGMSANIWLDEFAFFEQPDATWRAILPSITNPLRGGEKRFIITSTPNGRGGAGKRFFDIVTSEPRSNMRWSVHTVTLRNAIADGLPVDYNALAEAMDDPIAEAQELNCEFLDSTQTLLPYDLIALAESFDATESYEPSVFDPSTARDLRVGIDFGRTNDPTVCWTLERIGDVLHTREVLVLRDIDSPAQEAILRTRIAAARRVCFDYTGPGIGLGDYLVKQFGAYKPESHEFGKLELCTFTAKFKREIFPKLRKAFVAPTRLRIPVSQAIREDLHAMEQIVHNGEYTYAAPHTKDGHSDRCTALALAIRAAEGSANIMHATPIPRPPQRGWSARISTRKSARKALIDSILREPEASHFSKS